MFIWILSSLSALSIAVLLYVSFFPPQISQTLVDQIANQGLSSYLTGIGVTGPGSICWLGDPQGRYLKQFIGASKDLQSRWREKARVRKWKAQLSCFSSEVKAIVVLFPLVPDVFGLPQQDSTLIQKEVSEVMSQSRRGINLERANVSFHLESGVTFVIYTVKNPS